MAALPNLTFEVTPAAGSEPLPVVIVRDEKSLRDLLTTLVGGILGWFVIAWIIMLLVPVVFPEHPLSYWQSFALYVLGSYIFKTDIGSVLRLYTRRK